MNKLARYQRIADQLEELFQKTDNFNARMATTCALLHHKFNYYFWTGFYSLIDGQLTVQTYQGPVACLVLKKRLGVCWASINEKKSIIVSDVEKFPGHIACDSRSKSEIVIPLIKNNEVLAVLDIDSKELNSFDDEDREGLEIIIKLLLEG
ncbi:GAF domain-containing protein [bacterium]|nr:GAF domain-containing protein [bacterium]